MASSKIKSWIESVALHPDVVSEDFSEDVFALDLGPLAEGAKSVPAVYRDPEHFFRASYVTSGLRSLLKDVLSRLSGGEGNRVLKLFTPFGGGKSHTLAALLHAARNRAALDVIPEGKGLPRPDKVRTAVFDGQFFDATNGKMSPGDAVRCQTMWGWIAFSLGGKKAYELLRKQDEARVAPGADEILAVLGDSANLILLDEALGYLISTGGIQVGQTNLRSETLTFLQRLTVAVSNTKKTAFVFSLQSSKRESLEYLSLLQTVEHLAARKDQQREPVESKEILAVIQRRLLAKLPDAADSSPAAGAYQELVTQMRRSYAQSKAEQQQAEEEGIALRDRVRQAYPFHPALIDIMSERWAAIPDFQRTRGALRFLAACLRAYHKKEKSGPVLGPGDVPMEDSEVRLAFFKEVGQQADFQPVLEHDLIGPNARARRIDQRRAKESPTLAKKQPASRLATAILMYSFGGLRREQAGRTETLPPGVSEPELLAAVVGPDLDSVTAQACLKELKEQCLYLHFDGVRYCFKKDPNVTLLIEQEAESVARDEKQVRQEIKRMLESRLAGHHDAVVWPEKPGDIPDKEPMFLVGYLPLEFAGEPKSEQDAKAVDLCGKFGGKQRSYRNGLGLAAPATDQVEPLRSSVRYLLAVGRVKDKARQYNLTDEQKSQLRERDATERSAAESCFLKLYSEVLLPVVKDGGLGVVPVSVGGRPLQTTLNDKREAAIHDRVMELLVGVARKVFDKVAPTKIVELFKLGGKNTPGIKTSEVVDGFYSYLGYPRLTTSDAIRSSIARGVAEGHFGYLSGAGPTLGPDGKYQVAREKVRFGSPVADDEVDLETGFLIMPSAMPAAPETEQTKGEGGQTEGGGEGGGGGESGGEDGAGGETAAARKVVDLSFEADSTQLYNSWKPLANLADMAGQVKLSVHAESDKGFDKSKLENGVLEPLREANLIE